MEKQNKDPKITEAQDNKPAPPLGVIIDRARDEVGSVVLHYMNDHGIPASIFDYVLSDIVSRVKDMKAAEYAALIGRSDENGKYSGPAGEN